MKNSTLNIKSVNVALRQLHEEAQDATEDEMSSIAHRYLKIVGDQDFKKYVLRVSQSKFKNVDKLIFEDLYQDVCIKMNDFILRGKLPKIEQSGISYFMRAFNNLILTFLKSKDNESTLSFENSPEVADKSKNETAVYDMENLKNCFYMLYFLQPKVKMEKFLYYCSRISFSANYYAAHAIYNEQKPWENLSKSEIAKLVQKVKDGSKTENRIVSRMFNSPVRAMGFHYKVLYFSENADQELQHNSELAVGIMWHYYIQREILTERFSIPVVNEENLLKKLTIDSALLNSEGRSKSNPFFNFRSLLYAMLTVFEGFDKQGKKYSVMLLDELNNPIIQDQKFIDWFCNALTEIISLDFSETYKKHEEDGK